MASHASSPSAPASLSANNLLTPVSVRLMIFVDDILIFYSPKYLMSYSGLSMIPSCDTVIKQSVEL
jgi:hypothetical protein